MTDLVEWLKVQIDEDERVASTATPGPWKREWAFSTHFVVPDSARDIASGNVSRLKSGQRTDAEHIARHDPARVLREVEAKRRLIGQILQYESTIDSEWCCHGADEIGAGTCPETRVGEIEALRLLALPYADRDGYCEEWAA